MADIDSHRNTSTGRESSYALAPRFADGSNRVAMTLTCNSCHRPTIVNWNQGYDDRQVTRFWQAKGWDFHPNKRRSCICPDCKSKPAKGPEPMQTKTPTANVVNLPPSASIMPMTPLPTPLTADQRHKIRKALETHFDDGTGKYQRDWSDKRIAEHIDVPLVAVRDIREAAYGPLVEIDEELVNLRNEFDTLKSMVHDFERRLITKERTTK